MVARIELEDEYVVDARPSPEEGVDGEAEQPEGEYEPGTQAQQNARVGNPFPLVVAEPN